MIADVAVLLLDYFLRVSSGRWKQQGCSMRAPLFSRVCTVAKCLQKGSEHLAHPPLLTPPGCCCACAWQVALRGGVDLRREVVGATGRKSAPGMNLTMRGVSEKIPAAAAAMLLHMGAWAPAAAMSATVAAAAGVNTQRSDPVTWPLTELHADHHPPSLPRTLMQHLGPARLRRASC